jgi:hypothetical protein
MVATNLHTDPNAPRQPSVICIRRGPLCRHQSRSTKAARRTEDGRQRRNRHRTVRDAGLRQRDRPPLAASPCLQASSSMIRSSRADSLNAIGNAARNLDGVRDVAERNRPRAASVTARESSCQRSATWRSNSSLPSNRPLLNFQSAKPSPLSAATHGLRAPERQARRPGRHPRPSSGSH